MLFSVFTFTLLLLKNHFYLSAIHANKFPIVACILKTEVLGKWFREIFDRLRKHMHTSKCLMSQHNICTYIYIYIYTINQG